ncbi:MAG: imidazole glycerol phosphate synthase subunit HisF [Betaproteobacteria bacterium]
MLKARVIAVVLVKDATVVQSIGFRRYLPVGRPDIAISYLDRWGADEILVLHIDGRPASPETVASYSRHCQVPLSVGGGVRDAATVQRIIQAGADKIVLNTAAYDDPALIGQAAERFGEQCVVVSIDARRGMAYVDGGKRATGTEAAALAVGCAERGAGEILINSIERDGSKQGYDLELIRTLVGAVRIPVIACGGAGTPEHMHAALAQGPAAVAAANFFHFTEHSVILAKSWLAAHGVPVRLDSYASYAGRELDAQGRLARLPEEALDHLRFRYVPEEVI